MICLRRDIERRAPDAIGVDEADDHFLVRAVHDPVVFAPHHQRRHANPAPRGREIELLQLVIERRGAPVLRIGFVVPHAAQVRARAHDSRRRQLQEEISGVEFGEARDCWPRLRGRRARHYDAPALEVDHVLEPGLRPSAHRDIAQHGRVAGNQRRKTAAVADADHDDALGIDARMFLHRGERSLVAIQLSRKIGRGAYAFAVAQTPACRRGTRWRRFFRSGRGRSWSVASWRAGGTSIESQLSQPAMKMAGNCAPPCER